MSATIAPVGSEQLGEVLPLIAGYQRFYGVERPDDARNRSFFARFVAPSEEGLLLGAWDGEGEAAIGFACLYWLPESVSARDVALLHDLYVEDSRRGTGAGRALIDAAIEAAQRRGAASLSWRTALDNRRAQRLYERYPATRSAWFEYEVELGPSASPPARG